MQINDLHSWDLAYADARQLQTRLAEQVCLTPMPRPVRSVAGQDCAFDKSRGTAFAAAVVLSFPDFRQLESASARTELTFPYIPGLLSFREAPACLAAIRKLQTVPALFRIDAQGTAHPRRRGRAAHLGLFLSRPTIGCAKSRLIGTFDQPGPEKGDFAPLSDAAETIGAVLRTRTAVKPLFISPGHLCTLSDAVQWTLRCTTRYRLPEPTRLAHQQVTALKKTC
jgi:deoxyribonuclease V